MARAGDVMIKQAKKIYISKIAENEFFSSHCFLKEI